MKKILYISSFLPYDTPFAGSQTSYRILKKIAKNDRVDLIVFSTEVEINYVDRFISFCKKEKNVNLLSINRVNKFTRIINALFFFFLPALLVARFSFKYLFKLNRNYDFVYADWSQGIFFGYILSKLYNVPIFYSIADVITQSLERKYKNERNIFKKFIFSIEYLKAALFERRILDGGKLIIVQSIKDKLILVNMGINEEKILAITPYFSQNMKFEEKNDDQMNFNILFWGAMNRSENVDAVEYYLSSFHERLKSKIKNYRFIIAGANPSRSIIQNYANDESIYISGFIEDPSEIFNIAHLSVAPLRLGAGIKVKILESLYMGLPTITTDIGAEGIYLSDSDGLYIENDKERFLKRIINIYENYQDINKSNIRRNMKCRFDFDQSLDKIDNYFKRM